MPISPAAINLTKGAFVNRPKRPSNAKFVNGLNQAGRADLAIRSTGAAPAAEWSPIPEPNENSARVTRTSEARRDEVAREGRGDWPCRSERDRPGRPLQR